MLTHETIIKELERIKKDDYRKEYKSFDYIYNQILNNIEFVGFKYIQEIEIFYDNQFSFIAHEENIQI